MKQGILRLALLTCSFCLFTGLEAGSYTQCSSAKASVKTATQEADAAGSTAGGFELSPLETFLLNI